MCLRNATVWGLMALALIVFWISFILWVRSWDLPSACIWVPSTWSCVTS